MGRYITMVYTLYAATLANHFSKEVEKRGAKTLLCDASCKMSKHLCQYWGEPIFRGLVTMTDEIGEVRIHYQVVTDSHEQIKTPFRGIRIHTLWVRIFSTHVVSTDSPLSDKKLFLDALPPLQDYSEIISSNQMHAIKKWGSSLSIWQRETIFSMRNKASRNISGDCSNTGYYEYEEGIRFWMWVEGWFQ